MAVKEVKTGEVWFCRFPLEENPKKFIVNPVVVLNADTLEVLPVKVEHISQLKDQYDSPTIYWQEKIFRFAPTTKAIKTKNVTRSKLLNCMGELYSEDFTTIQSLA